MLDAAALAHTALVHPAPLRRDRTASAVQGDQVPLQQLRFFWRQNLRDTLAAEVGDHAPEAWIAVCGHQGPRGAKGRVTYAIEVTRTFPERRAAMEGGLHNGALWRPYLTQPFTWT